MTDNTIWYLFHNGKQVGPLAKHEVAQIYDDTVPDKRDLYWHEGMPEWKTMTPDVLTSIFKGEAAKAVIDLPKSDVPEKSVERAEPTSAARFGTDDVDPGKPAVHEPSQSAEPLSTIPLGEALARQQKKRTLTGSSVERAPDVHAEPIAKSPVEPMAPVLDPHRVIGLGGWMIPVVAVSVLLFVAGVYLFICSVMWFGDVTTNPGINAVTGKFELTMVILVAFFGLVIMILWTAALLRDLFRWRTGFPGRFRSTVGVPMLFGSIILVLVLFEKWGFTGLTRFVKIPEDYINQTVTLFGNTYSVGLAGLVLLLTLIALFVGISAYLNRSKRVRNTFIY